MGTEQTSGHDAPTWHLHDRCGVVHRDDACPNPHHAMNEHLVPVHLLLDVYADDPTTFSFSEKRFAALINGEAKWTASEVAIVADALHLGPIFQSEMEPKDHDRPPCPHGCGHCSCVCKYLSHKCCQEGR